MRTPNLLVSLLVVGMAVTGCSQSKVIATPNAPQPSAAARSAITLPLVSENLGCAGTASFKVPAGWSVDRSTLVNPTTLMKISAYCDNRSRYEAAQPGMAWTLDSVNRLVWDGVITNPAIQVQPLKLGTASATRFAHASSGSWWLSENALIDNNYVTIEAEVSGAAPNAKLGKDLAKIFDSVQVSSHDVG